MSGTLRHRDTAYCRVMEQWKSSGGGDLEGAQPWLAEIIKESFLVEEGLI